MIPPDSVLHRGRPAAPAPDQWGDRLFIVIAREWAVTPGQEAWAGIGWVQDQQSGRGLFVEHHASKESDLDDLIEQSLVSMCSYRKGDWGPIGRLTHGTMCVDQPTCTLVSAIYESVTWPSRSS